MVSPGGKLVREMKRDVKPVPITGADRERLAKRQHNDIMKQFMREVKMRPDKPCIVDIRVDGEGYILVGLADPDDAHDHYDVYDPKGDFMTSATLAPIEQMQVIRNAHLYWVKHPEEGPPQVCRGRLVTTQRR